MPPASSVTFTVDIRPLFREKDRDAMRRAFDLWAYEDVVAHAAAIASKLHDGIDAVRRGLAGGAAGDLFDRWMERRHTGVTPSGTP